MKYAIFRIGNAEEDFGSNRSLFNNIEDAVMHVSTECTVVLNTYDGLGFYNKHTLEDGRTIVISNDEYYFGWFIGTVSLCFNRCDESYNLSESINGKVKWIYNELMVMHLNTYYHNRYQSEPFDAKDYIEDCIELLKEIGDVM